MKLYNFTSANDISFEEKDFSSFIIIGPHDKISPTVSEKIKLFNPSAKIMGITSGRSILSNKIQILAMKEPFLKTKIYDMSLPEYTLDFNDLPTSGDLLVFADGFQGVSVCDFLKKLKKARPDLKTFGALAADDWTFDNSKILYDNNIYTNHIAIASIKNDFFSNIQTYQSYDLITPYYTITKKFSNNLCEVEDINVIDFFKKILKKTPDVTTLADFGIAFKGYDSDKVEYRAILGMKDGKIQVSGSIEDFTSFSLAGCNSVQIEKDYKKIFSNSGKSLKLIIDCSQRLNAINPSFLSTLIGNTGITENKDKGEEPLNTLFIRSYGEISPSGLKNYVCLTSELQ